MCVCVRVSACARVCVPAVTFFFLLYVTQNDCLCKCGIICGGGSTQIKSPGRVPKQITIVTFSFYLFLTLNDLSTNEPLTGGF